MHTLLFCEPGHFHAALTLRVPNPRLARHVHVYAAEGPELQGFLDLVRAFNSRAADPTDWDVQVHEGPQPLERLIAERRGDAVVLAGRNDRKLETIARLHAAGLPVLADKPWIIDSAGLPHLEQVTGAAPLALDIMTGRHDPMAVLRRHLAHHPDVFGDFIVDDPDGPAIELGSVHHLYKLVNGQPLVRPSWYFDVAVQGDGVVDIMTHLVNQAQWLLEDDAPFAYGRDLRLRGARRWATEVPLADFTAVTGQAAFPPGVSDAVRDGVLHLACNAEIDYTLRGVTVRNRAEWFLREPPGSGDRHRATLRGSESTIHIVQGPETGHRAELIVQPRPGSGALAALRDWVAAEQQDHPGLAVQPAPAPQGSAAGEAWRVDVPDALRTGHETHFAEVLDQFLDHLDAGTWPAATAAAIRMRYTLLARARDLALEAGTPTPEDA